MKNLVYPILRATLGLVSTVAATSATFNANYDNLTTSEIGLPPPLGTYEFLAYNSFGVLDSGTLGGIAPQSEPIFVGPDPQSPTGIITVVPPYKTFSLKSFWFGCDADLDQGVVNVATQCTITVAAFIEAGGQEVGVAEFTFTPPLSVVTPVPMIQAVLPNDFENVYNVTIVRNNPSVIALGLDNLEYTVSK